MPLKSHVSVGLSTKLIKRLQECLKGIKMYHGVSRGITKFQGESESIKIIKCSKGIKRITGIKSIKCI